MSDMESSSSSDAEEVERCREAAMPAWGLEQRPRGPVKPTAGTMPRAGDKIKRSRPCTPVAYKSRERMDMQTKCPKQHKTSLCPQTHPGRTSHPLVCGRDRRNPLLPVITQEGPALSTQPGAANTQLPTTQPSFRHKANEHEQDGNELQTTPEFRAHVAKKLGALLDSSITISEVVKEPRKAEVQRVTPEDDGFRLFFTSIPGGPEKEATPKPQQKRLPSSSSSDDGGEELQRCREAAVSASDILQESAIHGPVNVEEKVKKKKKKLKKKAKKEASTDIVTATTTTSKAAVRKQEQESAELNGDQAPLGTKKKKRKKKAKRASEASPFPPARSATAVPAN
ncbi:protein CUSTOS isoform X1 [Camelus dromedarius]|uniref:protein CUSTOS isoform X1 n=1 Tax=Camelus dromedarius TaxID=9838 RepID=UPI00311952A5